MLQAQRELLRTRLTYLEAELAGKQYLTGQAFTSADAYLFVVLGWFGHVGIDLAAWPNVKAFHARVAARAAVQQVMKDEGLLKAA